MKGLLHMIGFIMKFGLVFGLITGIVGTSGFIGVCTITDVDCVGDINKIENTNQETTLQEPQNESNDKNQTQPTEEEEEQEEEPQIVGPEPPDYPPRTHKKWDRTRIQNGELSRDRNSTAKGDNWKIFSKDVEKFLAEDINNYREKNGKDPHKYSHSLASVSYKHSKDMANRGYYNHKNPDGEQPWDRWGSNHCRESYGENLMQTRINSRLSNSRDYVRTADILAQELLKDWQNSPGHNELMLTNEYDAVGYGIHFKDNNDGTYGAFVTMNTCEYN